MGQSTQAESGYTKAGCCGTSLRMKPGSVCEASPHPVCTVSVTGQGIASASYSGNALSVSLPGALDSSNFAVLVTSGGPIGVVFVAQPAGASAFNVLLYDSSTKASTNWTAGAVVHVAVFGN